MDKALGMVEYTTVSTGMQAADLIVKTASVEILEASTVCPGKYMVTFAGDISAVKAALENCKVQHPARLIDSFVLGNPHETIFPAIYGAVPVGKVSALGVLETFDAAQIIVAADTAAKTAVVELIELRIARGMCGKSYMFITGEVAAVTAAIEKARAKCGEKGMFLNSSVIPSPDPKLWQSIL